MIRNFVLPVALAIAPLSVMAQEDMGNLGPDEGDRELTLTGTGASDEDIENGSYGLSGDYGWYLSPTLALGVRQSLNYVQVDDADDRWNASTRGFLNYHFGMGNARPFVGFSIGGVYGDDVDDTGFAGPEAGLKYYVRDETFVFGRAEYQFFFESADDAEENFDDGSFVYAVGLGYNF